MVKWWNYTCSSTLGDKNTWVLERSRRLYGRRPFDYAALTKDGSALIVAAEAGFVFDFDSLKPVREEEPMETALNQQGSFWRSLITTHSIWKMTMD